MLRINELAQNFPVLNNVSFAFVGQLGTTTGTPHPTTGNLSTYGDFIAFSGSTHQADRDQFVTDYYDNNNTAVKCTLNTGRKFKQGVSVQQYVESMAMVAANLAH